MSTESPVLQETVSSTNGDVPLIKMVNIGRRFGNIIALEGVNFEVGYQEVIGLLGDNGAGKSTLIKVLTGVHPSTSGQIYFEGQSVHMTSPQDARDLGIETVYQDLALVPLMNISRNFYLGREPAKWIGPLEILDKETMDNKTTTALSHIGIKIRGAAEPVGTLSGGERQSIAIGRAVHFGNKLLILDEPTSALSIGETRKVITYVKEAKSRGLSVIFITHNIHHVFEVADRFTIISHGHKVGDFRKDEVTQDEVAGMIMGEPVPERLVNREPIVINTRPVEVRTTVDGIEVAPQKTMSVQQHSAAKRTRDFTLLAVIVAVYLLIGGAILYYTRPQGGDIVGVPPLVRSDNGEHFIYKLPQSWRVDRSESGIKHAIDANKDYALVITWDSVRKLKISPTTALDKLAAKVQNDDGPILGRDYQPGSDVTVAGRPAYRFDWVNTQANRSGVDYILIDATNNFFHITIDGPTALWTTDLKPLADEIIGAIAFN